MELINYDVNFENFLFGELVKMVEILESEKGLKENFWS